MRSRINFLPIVFFLFGIYFLNSGLNLFSLPEFFAQINRWIILLGGILFFVAGYRAIVFSKRRILRRAARL